MDKIFEKSQALFGEQAEWFAGHSTQAVQALVADTEALTTALRTGVEAAMKHQAAFFETAFGQFKKAGEAHAALLREVFAQKAA